MSIVVCITGMHRSGTSLTASWLAKCGIELGHGGLHGPTESNPEGHFEDIEITNLHSYFLRKVFPKSKGWIVLRALPTQIKDEFIEKAQKIVSARHSRYAQWGWKDPRTLPFLGLWKFVVPEMKTVILCRPWQDTVASLLRRSHRSGNEILEIGYSQAVRMWRHYAKTALHYLDQNPNSTLLVWLSDLLRYDRKFLEDMNQKFHIRLPFRSLMSVYHEDYLHTALPRSHDPIADKILRLRTLENHLQVHSWKPGPQTKEGCKAPPGGPTPKPSGTER